MFGNIEMKRKKEKNKYGKESSLIEGKPLFIQ